MKYIYFVSYFDRETDSIENTQIEREKPITDIDDIRLIEFTLTETEQINIISFQLLRYEGEL